LTACNASKISGRRINSLFVVVTERNFVFVSFIKESSSSECGAGKRPRLEGEGAGGWWNVISIKYYRPELLKLAFKVNRVELALR